MALQIAALNDPTRGGGRHGSAAARAAARRTTEAEEARLTSKYEHALLFMRDGALEDAERELRSILDHDMMSGPPNHRPVEEYPAPAPKPQRDAEDSDTDDNSEYESEDDTPEMTLTSTMTQVKFLALKNLGEARVGQSRETRKGVAPRRRRRHPREPRRRLRPRAPLLRRRGGDRRDGRLAVEAPRIPRRVPSPPARRPTRARSEGLAIAPTHPLMLEDLAETLLAVGDLDACARRGAPAEGGPGARAGGEDARRPGRVDAARQVFSVDVFFFSRLVGRAVVDRRAKKTSTARRSRSESRRRAGGPWRARPQRRDGLGAARGLQQRRCRRRLDGRGHTATVSRARAEFKTQWPDMSLRYGNRERDPTTWQGVRFDGPGMGNGDDRLIKLVVVGPRGAGHADRGGR